MIIYKATCLVNNKVYIGQTKKTLEERKKNHYSCVRKGKFRCPKFHKAIHKHGEENFIWEIVCKCNTQEELNKLEIKYIAETNSIDNGYNINEGGFVNTWAKGRTYEEMYGEEKAKQLKQKRSENFKKIVNAAEFRNRLLIVHKNNKGRKLSQETKEKMSKSHMGEKNHFYGKKHSEETKKLIGSKSKNRNWFRGYVIKIDEKIFFEIIINLTFKQSVFKEISEKYKTKTGQKIGKKTILKFGIKCGVPFRTAKGAKALNNIKDFVINYKKNKTELNESQ